jgi:hypothetical protein
MYATRRTARRSRWSFVALLGAVGLVFAIPAASVPPDRILDEEQLRHFSQGAVIGYLVKHPEAAEGFDGLDTADEFRDEGRPGSPGGTSRSAGGEGRGVFNDDDLGLPQNEESITACKSRTSIVLGGTNDYRGLVEPIPSVTGWHFSTNGGRTLTNEGRLPQVTTSAGEDIESGGDPVKVAGTGCKFLYASSLAYDLTGVGEPTANGIAVYRSTPAQLASCSGGPAGAPDDCWDGRTVSEAAGNVFLDKEWMDVGLSGGQEWVWVTYTRFIVDPASPEGFTSAEIEAVRCDAALVSCTAPIPISYGPGGEPADLDTQFSDVTIAPDGRVYVTWSEIICELTGDPDCPPDSQQIFVHKIRVAEPGSVVFSDEQVIYAEEKPIPFADSPLHANEFRIATYPKNDVAIINGEPRIFVVWDACKYLFDALDTVCEESRIRLMYSDDPIGAAGTWQGPFNLSRGGDSYFPSIVSNDSQRRPKLALAWFTNRYDPQFHNRQDVEFTWLDPRRPWSGGDLKRITAPSNESEADPSLEGGFIGDYIEVFATGSKAWVHFNANYRHERALGQGIPVAQQDNYLVRLGHDGGDD